jgi:uncharacterized protein (DUF1697 family)
MAAIICFLRGVNVGGKGKVPMRELKTLMEDELGCQNVKTLLQSGNVVFTAKGTLPALKKKIETAIEKAFKYKSDAYLLTPADLRKIVDGNPYTDAAKRDSGHLIAYVLPGRPLATAKAKLDTVATQYEAFTIKPHVVYAHFGAGMGRSRMAATMDRALGVRGTARNWNTLTKVLELAEAL